MDHIKQMKKQKHKVLKIVLLIVAAIILVGLTGTAVIFRDEIKIISSIKKVEGCPAYTMRVESDYHFDEFLASGGARTDTEVSEFLTEKISEGFYKVDVNNDGIGCSTLSAKTDGGAHIWGRNFDWKDSVPIIVQCIPEDGYASLSTCDFRNITKEVGASPNGIAGKMLAIAALYVPMDGINSAGLCVADLEVNEGGMPEVDTEKTDLTITTAMRLVLNRAANVQEAVDLLSQYDIHASGHISHHLSLSDAWGNAVSIEFTKDGFTVVDSNEVTNFNLSNGDIAAGGESARNRYEKLCSIYDEHDGILTREQAFDAMQQVAQSGPSITQWTVIHEVGSPIVDYYFLRDYDKKFEFEIPEQKE